MCPSLRGTGEASSSGATGSGQARSGGRTAFDDALDWINNRGFLGWVLAVLVTVAIILTPVLLTWDLVDRSRHPRIDVGFLTDSGYSQELAIQPAWPNQLCSGFSDAFPVSIALRNRGHRPATNVRIYLMLEAGVADLIDASGHPERRAILQDAADLRVGTYVIAYPAESVAASPVLYPFEPGTHLRVRLRDVGAVALLKDGAIFLNPFGFDLVAPDADSFGQILLRYLVTYDESPSPASGVLVLTLDPGSIEKLDQARTNWAKLETEFVDNHKPPEMESVQPVTVKELQLLEPSGLVTGTVQLREYASGAVAWRELVYAGQPVYVELDEDEDGLVETIYAAIPASSPSAWLHLRPIQEHLYVPFDAITDLGPASLEKYLREEYSTDR